MNLAHLPQCWTAAEMAAEWLLTKSQVMYVIASCHIAASARVSHTHVYDDATKHQIATALLQRGKLPISTIPTIFCHEEVATLLSRESADVLFPRPPARAARPRRS